MILSFVFNDTWEFSEFKLHTCLRGDIAVASCGIQEEVVG